MLRTFGNDGHQIYDVTDRTQPRLVTVLQTGLQSTHKNHWDPATGIAYCQAAHEELQGRGVDFVETAEERPSGIDSAFRDPSGNVVRLTQLREPARV